MFKISPGLDIPLEGAPKQTICDGPTITQVAVLGADYVGMKPTMEVAVGDQVRKGQVIFTDKKTPGVQYTAPASGTIAAINRGAKRVFQSVVIDVAGNESISFKAYSPDQLPSLSRDDAQQNLIDAGLWTAFRTRPFSKVPVSGSIPASIFVTAMDTNPLAADPAVIINERADDFTAGLQVLKILTDGAVYQCQSPQVQLPTADGVTVETFAGKHPAGLVGTHIHFLDPVGLNKTVWAVGYQDVIAIGALFLTGVLDVSRVICVAGPQVKEPCLVKTVLGASVDQLLAGELKEGDNRIISGSVLDGSIAKGPTAYLSRYTNQVTVLLEGTQREFLRYLSPGQSRHSILNIYLSRLLPGKRFAMTTNTNGSERAMLPLGSFEAVMPLDILATQLLRALLVGDVDNAIALGALELTEEDLSLCTYVCAGKYEYGPILRDSLNRIEQEG